MINLKVKTLDGNTHSFSVPEDFTVEQFKTQIESVLEIPPDRQRLLFHGKPMNNPSLLSSFDINDKVIHLVTRPPNVPPPPASAASSSTSNNTPLSGSRRRRNDEQRNRASASSGAAQSANFTGIYPAGNVELDNVFNLINSFGGGMANFTEFSVNNQGNQMSFNMSAIPTGGGAMSGVGGGAMGGVGGGAAHSSRSGRIPRTGGGGGGANTAHTGRTGGRLSLARLRHNYIARITNQARLLISHLQNPDSVPAPARSDADTLTQRDPFNVSEAADAPSERLVELSGEPLSVRVLGQMISEFRQLWRQVDETVLPQWESQLLQDGRPQSQTASSASAGSVGTNQSSSSNLQSPEELAQLQARHDGSSRLVHLLSHILHIISDFLVEYSALHSAQSRISTSTTNNVSSAATNESTAQQQQSAQPQQRYLYVMSEGHMGFTVPLATVTPASSSSRRARSRSYRSASNAAVSTRASSNPAPPRNATATTTPVVSNTTQQQEQHDVAVQADVSAGERTRTTNMTAAGERATPQSARDAESEAAAAASMMSAEADPDVNTDADEEGGGTAEIQFDIDLDDGNDTEVIVIQATTTATSQSGTAASAANSINMSTSGTARPAQPGTVNAASGVSAASGVASSGAAPSTASGQSAAGTHTAATHINTTRPLIGLPNAHTHTSAIPIELTTGGPGSASQVDPYLRCDSRHFMRRLPDSTSQVIIGHLISGEAQPHTHTSHASHTHAHSATSPYGTTLANLYNMSQAAAAGAGASTRSSSESGRAQQQQNARANPASSTTSSTGSTNANASGNASSSSTSNTSGLPFNIDVVSMINNVMSNMFQNFGGASSNASDSNTTRVTVTSSAGGGATRSANHVSGNRTSANTATSASDSSFSAMISSLLQNAAAGGTHTGGGGGILSAMRGWEEALHGMRGIFGDALRLLTDRLSPMELIMPLLAGSSATSAGHATATASGGVGGSSRFDALRSDMQALIRRHEEAAGSREALIRQMVADSESPETMQAFQQLLLEHTRTQQGGEAAAGAAEEVIDVSETWNRLAAEQYGLLCSAIMASPTDTGFSRMVGEVLRGCLEECALLLLHLAGGRMDTFDVFLGRMLDVLLDPLTSSQNAEAADTSSNSNSASAPPRSHTGLQDDARAGTEVREEEEEEPLLNASFSFVRTFVTQQMHQIVAEMNEETRQRISRRITSQYVCMMPRRRAECVIHAMDTSDDATDATPTANQATSSSTGATTTTTATVTSQQRELSTAATRSSSVKTEAKVNENEEEEAVKVEPQPITELRNLGEELDAAIKSEKKTADKREVAAVRDSMHRVAAAAVTSSANENEPSWSTLLPNHWIPIIERDTAAAAPPIQHDESINQIASTSSSASANETQQQPTRNSVQRSFSDSYTAGMPAKRRKIMTSQREAVMQPPSQLFNSVLNEAVQQFSAQNGGAAVAPSNESGSTSAATANGGGRGGTSSNETDSEAADALEQVVGEYVNNRLSRAHPRDVAEKAEFAKTYFSSSSKSTSGSDHKRKPSPK